jgi:Mg2+ and Co2+ transporter CorA
MNASLFWLTNFSVALIPVQTLSGWYGMNFAIPDGLLALDGSECDFDRHFPGDPCTWLMPELRWEYSYLVFCCACIGWICSYSIICYRSLSPAKAIVIDQKRPRPAAV